MRSLTCEPNDTSVHVLHTNFLSGTLNLRPEYQRGLVWPQQMMQYLIWCMLRGRDINHFYLHAQTGKRGKFWFDVVDGQQRLNAIFSYLNGDYALAKYPNHKHRTLKEEDGLIDGISVSGLKFADLPDEIQGSLRLYKIHSTVISGDDKNAIIEQFVDLQSSRALTPQQIREAYPCPLNTAIRDIERDHPLIPNIYFSQGKHGAYARLMLARLFYYEQNQQLVGTDARVLTAFYLSSRFSLFSKQDVEAWKQTIEDRLTILHTLLQHAKMRVPAGHVLLLYWLVRQLPIEGISISKFSTKIMNWYNDNRNMNSFEIGMRKASDHTNELQSAYAEIHQSFINSIKRYSHSSISSQEQSI